LIFKGLNLKLVKGKIGMPLDIKI